MTAAITDFNQFSNLRAGANSRDPAVLREVAGQFEALFIQTMLKNMRDTALADPVFGQSDQHEMYQDMLDQQYALEMSAGRGIGLADMLVRQLGGEDRFEVRPEQQFALSHERFTGVPVGPVATFNASVRARGASPFISNPGGSSLAVPDEVSASSGTESGQVGSIPAWSTPEDFTRQIWPHAERAASKLNVQPEALVAQAALETGWGKHVMQRPDGSSSLNLFGIKANHHWRGATVSKPTVEYRDGILQRERATFRAYPSLASTFNDYADFITEQPRYKSALNHGENTAGFTSALQASGYATDPNYAKKIDAILDSDVLRKALQWLKEDVVGPITYQQSTGDEMYRQGDNRSR